jgi:hypothetical protein
LSNDETFLIAVLDSRLYKIETKKFDYNKSDYEYCPWWPKRLDAFHPDDTYMVSRYYSD